MGACSSKKSADATSDIKPIPASGEVVATVPPTKIAIGLSDEKAKSKPQDVVFSSNHKSEAPTAAELAEADAVAIRVIALALTMRKTEVAKDAKAEAAPCPKSAAQAEKAMDPKLTVLVNEFAKQSGVPHMREALCAALAAHGAMEPPRVGSPSSQYSRFPKKTHERSPQHFVPVSKAQERFWGSPQASLAKVAGSRLTKIEADLGSMFKNLEQDLSEIVVVPNVHSSKPSVPTLDLSKCPERVLDLDNLRSHASPSEIVRDCPRSHASPSPDSDATVAVQERWLQARAAAVLAEDDEDDVDLHEFRDVEQDYHAAARLQAVARGRSDRRSLSKAIEARSKLELPMPSTKRTQREGMMATLARKLSFEKTKKPKHANKDGPGAALAQGDSEPSSLVASEPATPTFSVSDSEPPSPLLLANVPEPALMHVVATGATDATSGAFKWEKAAANVVEETPSGREKRRRNRESREGAESTSPQPPPEENEWLAAHFQLTKSMSAKQEPKMKGIIAEAVKQKGGKRGKKGNKGGANKNLSPPSSGMEKLKCGRPSFRSELMDQVLSGVQ